MEFPLEKILTVSASDYCSSKNRNLTDYKLSGVIVFEYHWGRNVIEEFMKKIPEGTEVIVSFHYSQRGYSEGLDHMSGTALIPKNCDSRNI